MRARIYQPPKNAMQSGRAGTHAALAGQGFTDIRFEDISLRLAPSALQIPLFATRFAWRELWRARFRLSPLRRGHIVASYAAFLLGMWLPGFGYYMVTARKSADKQASQH